MFPMLCPIKFIPAGFGKRQERHLIRCQKSICKHPLARDIRSKWIFCGTKNSHWIDDIEPHHADEFVYLLSLMSTHGKRGFYASNIRIVVQEGVISIQFAHISPALIQIKQRNTMPSWAQCVRCTTTYVWTNAISLHISMNEVQCTL